MLFQLHSAPLNSIFKNQSTKVTVFGLRSSRRSTLSSTMGHCVFQWKWLLLGGILIAFIRLYIGLNEQCSTTQHKFKSMVVIVYSFSYMFLHYLTAIRETHMFTHRCGAFNNLSTYAGKKAMSGLKQVCACWDMSWGVTYAASAQCNSNRQSDSMSSEPVCELSAGV